MEIGSQPAPKGMVCNESLLDFGQELISILHS